MRTIAQALRDEIHYPLPSGFIENRLLIRGFEGEAGITSEILGSNGFRGAVADCLYSLIEAPNISESDKSISLAERDLILKKVNRIYKSIGEPEINTDEPTVQFGW